ncbi:ring-cleaving dioxygenase [Microvirga thermotolerans]|uniref:Ring-cleaving dioxygenase n=1 Tax=Microvirga thermotolerans TaxID=2651334 RepID=A0A5P9JXB7_9HYPH|nr:ring-cleaving dioxygenase [Microvirga thermotolerans]QFU16781.1 ring-cleaving dioxygenase [Microvirga thermotolerans]
MSHHGIHHVTAIAGPARRNIDFYTRVLGLRLVKKTVNFDDPGTYHFYYGNESGAPGSILTFFPWEHAAPGRAGAGSTLETGFRVPEASIGFWAHRFLEKGVEHGAPERRFGRSVLPFKDPDGTNLALVGVPDAEAASAPAGEIPQGAAISGLEGVTLLVTDAVRTGDILTDVLGLKETAREGSLVRYRGDAELGGTVDVRDASGFLPGRLGAGSVHHVAFRAADDAAQETMVQRLAEHHGIRATGQKDRNYFRSVYFREPGGVLFEIATDRPGFMADEPFDRLGRELKLPPFLEPHRNDIERALPALA